MNMMTTKVTFFQFEDTGSGTNVMKLDQDHRKSKYLPTQSNQKILAI